MDVWLTDAAVVGPRMERAVSTIPKLSAKSVQWGGWVSRLMARWGRLTMALVVAMGALAPYFRQYAETSEDQTTPTDSAEILEAF